MKNNRSLIIAGISIVLLVFSCLFILFEGQKEINNKLDGNIKGLQNQQIIMLKSLDRLAVFNQENLEHVTMSLVDYNYCFDKKSLGITKPDVFDAVRAFCMPSATKLVTKYSNKNSIFLNCFIEKSKMLKSNESLDRITQKCMEYEYKISEQIKATIEKINN